MNGLKKHCKKINKKIYKILKNLKFNKIKLSFKKMNKTNNNYLNKNKILTMNRMR